MKTEKRTFILYMAVAFGCAWSLQILTSTVGVLFQGIILAVSMFAPMLGVWAAKGGLGTSKTGIGYKIDFGRNWKVILAAWFSPFMFTVLGALIYFLVIPEQFDTHFGYIVKTYESAGVEITDGTIQGMPLSMFVAISCVQAVTYAPFINAFAAVGEEIGWRGYMTPVLKDWFGDKMALLLSGIIWGIWHAPVIALIGFNYGSGYWGAPITGILLFCVVTTAIGILLTWLYDRTNCIWVPAVFHGAFNAAANIPMCFTDGNLKGYILGPAPYGLIAGIPLFLVGIALFTRKEKKHEK